MEGEYTKASFSDIEDIFKRSELDLPEEEINIGKEYVQALNEECPDDEHEYQKLIRNLNKKHRRNFRKTDLLRIYYQYVDENSDQFPDGPDPKILKLLQKVKARSQSGVLVVTVFTTPSKFSCPEDCHYCPREVDENGKQTQPRSYRSDEPGCMRALRNDFCPIRQFFDRVRQLEICGHPVDKIEILVLGGTWSFYPVEYQEYFITALYYAANIYKNWRKNKDLEMQSLEEEQRINETARCRIIGITLETRPDCILGENKKTNRHYKKQDADFDPLAEIRRLRRYGVTRMQIGVQHTDDDILKKINRGCTNDQNVRAIKMLKENGFKVDIHIMLDLPGASPEIDMKMLKEVIPSPPVTISESSILFENLVQLILIFSLFSVCFSKSLIYTFSILVFNLLFWNFYDVFFGIRTKNSDWVVDYWKLYPTAVMDFTKIKEWYEEGTYKPYAEINDGELLNNVLMYAMEHCPVYTRVNRMFRDFPLKTIIGGCQVPNLRQVIENKMDDNDTKSRNIRDREIKDQKLDVENAQLVRRVTQSSGGTLNFLSFEDVEEDALYGLIRLRYNDPSPSASDLRLEMFKSPKVALIRELHVYGNLTKVNRGDEQDRKKNAQHFGFGTRLIKKAEEIARKDGYEKIAIIAGVGVRDYYRKFGYELEDTYMTKNL